MQLGIINRDPVRFPDFQAVGYHAWCNDGMAAASVVYALDQQPAFLPLQYNKDLPEEITAGGTRLLLVDFCPSREQFIELLKVWEDIFIIDHHEDKAWLANEFPNNCFFDQRYSGAVLTWYWLHGDVPVPALLEYVQDRDLWEWKLDRSREVSGALWNLDSSLSVWSAMLDEFPFVSLAVVGSHLLKAKMADVVGMAARSFLARVHGHTIALANAPVHPSEVAELLLQREPLLQIAASFSVVAPDKVRLSLRAREGGRCLELAQALGGGGHARAAGATLTVKQFSKIIGRIVS